ncbi:endonuclease [Klebsiella variicola]|nr:endonuclease [Klebsiella variicola]
MNLLVNAGIPVRTVSQYKIMHDKVIIADGRNVEVGSFNYTRAADRVNSENVLVVWDVPVVAQHGVSLDIENYCTVSLFFEQTYL